MRRSTQSWHQNSRLVRRNLAEAVPKFTLKDVAEILIKRIYASPSESDGVRILVDRLWPRGLSKDRARIDFWAREVAPSNELRKWYGHEPSRWPEFKARYFAELDSHPEAIEELVGHAVGERVTFLYSSKEQDLNNAVALREYLREQIRRA
jgi:uncharacterized protein YeaO (DUF488 family)